MSESEGPNTCVDRQTLYEELWQFPGTQLARKYGISDVALGKACRRHEIPRPPAGYWTMRKHGYEVERTPLPPISDERLREVTFHPLPTMDGRTNETRSGADARARIHVSEQFSSPHPLVEQARKQLRAATAAENRIVATNPQTALRIEVASASITRALKIMDALIRAWEEVGGTVKPGVKSFQGHYSTAFAIGADEVLTSLAERTESIPNWKPPKDSWHRYPPHRPNGELVFAIEYYQGERLRSKWADGKRQRLEDILDGVFDGLMVQVEDKKRRRLDHECEARQKTAAEHLRGAAQRFAEAENQRREGLACDVDCWQQAAAIRNYLSAMRQAIDAGTARPNNEVAFAEWFDWATWYADHIDPLVRARIRPQAAQPPTNKSIGDLDLTSHTRPIVVALGVTDADALHKVTEKQIAEIEKQYSSRIWSEICRVLEGLGYDMSERRYWL